MYCSLCISHIPLGFVCRNVAELGKTLGYLKLASIAFDELHFNVCTIPSNTYPHQQELTIAMAGRSHKMS